MARRKQSRKRRRSETQTQTVTEQLIALGFTQQQIDQVKQNQSQDIQFDAAFELLLANNNIDPMDQDDITQPPPNKKRKILDISNDSDDNNNNHNHHNEAKKMTHIQMKEEEFNQRKQEMEQHEEDYKKWEQRQIIFENTMKEIRDHIHDLFEKRPKIPHNEPTKDITMDQLLTERIQLNTIIDYGYNALKQHLSLCNKHIDDQYMMKERRKQDIEKERFKYEESKQEFESEKYALQLMENQVKSGKNVMTLVERNLFIVASAMNNNQENVDNEHFKTLNKKIQRVQNNNSNSKQENDDEEVSFECGICFMKCAQLSEIMIFDECYHYYCMECLKGYLKSKLEDRNVKNVLCPFQKCAHKLDHTEISYILTKEEYDKFDEYLLDKTLESAQDCRFCPTADCGAAMFGYADSPMLTCPQCEKQFCFNCGTEEWHRGVTCAAFKKWKEENGKADVKFDEWVKSQNAKQCPQCNSFIEKNGGCDHMTCQNCKYEFHWLTMEKWNGYGAQYNVPQNNRGRRRGNRARARDVFVNNNWMGNGVQFGIPQPPMVPMMPIVPLPQNQANQQFGNHIFHNFPNFPNFPFQF